MRNLKKWIFLLLILKTVSAVVVAKFANAEIKPEPASHPGSSAEFRPGQEVTEAQDGRLGTLGLVRGEVWVNGKPAKNFQAIQRNTEVTTGVGKCALFLGKEIVAHLDRETSVRVLEGNPNFPSEV